MWLQVINKVKVTHHSEGHIKVKVKVSSYVKFYLFQHIKPLCGYMSLIMSRSHIKVKVRSRTKEKIFKSLSILYCQQVGGLHSTEMRSCFESI